MPVRLGDVAFVQVGPEMRRGIAELNGEGEVAGGVIIMRSGKNALQTIAAVKAKLLSPSLTPPPSPLSPAQRRRPRGVRSVGRCCLTPLIGKRGGIAGDFTVARLVGSEQRAVALAPALRARFEAAGLRIVAAKMAVVRRSLRRAGGRPRSARRTRCCRWSGYRLS